MSPVKNKFDILLTKRAMFFRTTSGRIFVLTYSRKKISLHERRGMGYNAFFTRSVRPSEHFIFRNLPLDFLDTTVRQMVSNEFDIPLTQQLRQYPLFVNWIQMSVDVVCDLWRDAICSWVMKPDEQNIENGDILSRVLQPLRLQILSSNVDFRDISFYNENLKKKSLCPAIGPVHVPPRAPLPPFSSTFQK